MLKQPQDSVPGEGLGKSAQRILRQGRAEGPESDFSFGF
jgi:hypothetical protein